MIWTIKCVFLFSFQGHYNPNQNMIHCDARWALSHDILYLWSGCRHRLGAALVSHAFLGPYLAGIFGITVRARSKMAPEDVLSLSFSWSPHKRESLNTLRVVFSNAAQKGRSGVRAGLLKVTSLPRTEC